MTQPPVVQRKSGSSPLLIILAVVGGLTVVGVGVCILSGALLVGRKAVQNAVQPPVPVTVMYRSSAVGKGYVAQFHNTSEKYITVVVKFTNKTLGTTKSSALEIPAFGAKEIGWQEGWEFVSGESIDVSMADHQTLHVTIP